LIYVSEAAGNVVRRVTSAGVVTTLAGLAGTSGTANGTGTAARFNQPAGLALDASGNVYVADFGNHAIRRITTPGGVVTTYAGAIGANGSADGAATTVARFWFPFGLAADAAGNLFVADSYNQTIRRITSAGVVSTYAGAAGLNGSTDAVAATNARFFYPYAVAVDASSRVYVADYANHLVRRIDAAGTVRTIAGTPAFPGGSDGLASAARFRNPQGIAVVPDGSSVFVSDTENNAIRRLYPSPVPEITSPTDATGVVGGAIPPYSITATRLPILFGALGLPPGLAVNSSTGVITGVPGQAGVWDTTLTAENAAGVGTGTVRFTIAKAGATITLGNLSQSYDGAAKAPSYTTTPPGMPVVFTYDGSSSAPSAYGTYELVATVNDANYQGITTSAFQITAPINWSISTLVTPGLQSPAAVAVGPDGSLYIADSLRHVIFKRTSAGVVTVFAGLLDTPGYVNATGNAARFDTPSGLVFDPAGILYVSDTGNNRIRRISSGGAVTLLAGDGTPSGYDGTGALAAFYLPVGLALAPDGALFVADSGNYTLRRIALPSGVVTTVDTKIGNPEIEALNQPSGIAITSSSDLYVSDAGAHNIWHVSSGGIVTRIAGSGIGVSGYSDGTDSNALFNSPRALVLGSDGNIYVADTFNHTFRRVTPAGVATTLAGLAEDSGAADGFGSVARFSGPSGLAFAANGTLFIADTENGLIRLATPPPIVPVIAPPPAITLMESSAISGYSFSATGSPTNYSAVGLPPGLVLNSATGAVTGTPLHSGVYVVTLSVTNVLTTVSSTFNLTVNAPTWTAWRTSVFNSTQLASAAISGPAADPDGDGVANLFEYLQGRDPLMGDTAPPVIGVTGGYLTLTFEQLRAVSGWRIVAEQSTDLQVWNRGDSYVEVVQTTTLDSRREQIKVRINPTLGHLEKSFLRLTAEVAP
jgi:sugar lactone lactonase YvrE